MFDRKKAITVEPSKSSKQNTADRNSNGTGSSSSSYTLLKAIDPTNAVVEKRPTMLEGVEGEGVVLIGKGTRLVGEITNCTRVEIQGQFEGNVVSDEIIITECGSLNGYAKTERAVVHGNLEGNIIVANLLDISVTGRVSGELTYGQLAIAAGGYVGGTLQKVGSELENSPPPATTVMGKM